MLQAMREGFGRWLAVVILSLLAVGFIFFGTNFSSSITGTTFAAKVNGENIPVLEFERQVQAQQSQYQQLYRIELNDDLRRQIRRNVVETMVRNLALEQRVEKMGYRASDDRVSSSIRSTAAFQANGEFYMDLYLSRLGTEGLTPTAYEQQERVRLELSDLQNGIIDSTFLTPTEFRSYIEITNQRRRIAYATFAVDSFSDSVEISDQQIEEHYAANGSMYMTPETVDLQYVEVSQDDLAANVEVTEQDLRDYYDETRDQYETEEVRTASHILLNIGDDGVDAAVARAEAIVARIKAGESFEDLARELSDDPGTRDQGGNLGRITRGMLPGPFEDALFSMTTVGEISEPVVSDFGVQIIRLDGISEGETQPFEAVRDDLAEQLKSRRAEDLFFDTANELADKAYYAGGDLATVANEMGLPLETLDNFPRTGMPDVFENSAPVVQAAFSPQVLDQGLNSDLVELAENHVLVLRDTAHHLPEQRPLEQVRDQILEELRTRASIDLAIAAADQFRSEAEAGGDLAALAEADKGTWTEPDWVQRTDPDLPTELLSKVYALNKPAGDAPLWDSVSVATGDQIVVALYEVAPGDPDAIARDDRDARLMQLANQSGLIELSGYAAEVRADATVRIPEEVLEPQF